MREGLYAVPVFLILVAVEAISFRFFPDDEALGYDGKDSATSLATGTGALITTAVIGFGFLLLYVGLYEITPLRLSDGDWSTYLLLFLADDFTFYWTHRSNHTVRFLWATHVVHHSSERYNLSTALRQSVTVELAQAPFYLPLALLGFPPWMIIAQRTINAIYQFWLHTERIRKLPRPIEAIFNTPSHHRVHHGSNEIYLDRNYGGTLIIWDRLFRTFQKEEERVVYGLTKNIETYQPARVVFHEYKNLAHDLRKASNWKDRLRYLVHRPGWKPNQSRREAGEEVAGSEPTQLRQAWDQ